MDIDASQTPKSSTQSKFVSNIAHASKGLLIVVNPYDPNPHTPKRVEIIERECSLSPGLIASSSTTPLIRSLSLACMGIFPSTTS
jgi:hypothetical protein